MTIASDRSLVPPFVEEHDMGAFTVAYASSQEMRERYDVIAIPTSFLLDPDGRIRAKEVGFNASGVEGWRDRWSRLIEPLLERSNETSRPEGDQPMGE